MAQSKRKVELPVLKELIGYLDKEISAVGVFVNEDISAILKAVELGIGVIQLHGDESVDYISALIKELADNRGFSDRKEVSESKVQIWKAIRIGEDPSRDILQLKEYNIVDGILLDKYSQQEYGGTGEAFSWEALSKAKFPKPVILAGGLSVSNVREGIAALQPFCVDVSSGVETEGKKDKEKIREFIARVRE